MNATPESPRRAIVVGGGPAGLMAAEVLSAGGVAVDLYDAMPSVGRKFLLAGKGGMNLTHAEPIDAFRARYGARSDVAAPLLRAWLHRLREAGVRFHMRHRWLGWNGAALRFATPAGDITVQADATILALGGASWARLGSDGAWVPLLTAR